METCTNYIYAAPATPHILYCTAILPSSRHRRPFYHHLGIDGQSTLRSTAIQWTSAQHGHSMNIYAVLPIYKHLCNAAILQSAYLYTGRHSVQFYAVPPFCRFLCSAPFYNLHTSAKCRHSTVHTSKQCRHSTQIYAMPQFYIHARSDAISITCFYANRKRENTRKGERLDGLEADFMSLNR
jgi:hypothetical protein